MRNACQQRGLDASQYIHTGMTRLEGGYHEIQLRRKGGFDWEEIYMYPSQVKLTDYHSLVSEILHAAMPSKQSISPALVQILEYIFI